MTSAGRNGTTQHEDRVEYEETRQVPFEVVIRARQRSFDTVYTVYLRDEDGNRMKSSSGLDGETAFGVAAEWMRLLPDKRAGRGRAQEVGRA